MNMCQPTNLNNNLATTSAATKANNKYVKPSLPYPMEKRSEWFIPRVNDSDIGNSSYALTYDEDRIRNEVGEQKELYGSSSSSSSTYGFYYDDQEQQQYIDDHSNSIRLNCPFRCPDKIPSTSSTFLQEDSSLSSNTPFRLSWEEENRRNGVNLGSQSREKPISPQKPNTTTTTTTRAIALPASHISRTQSEVQLCEETAAAEWRDFCMFHRLVSGIREKQAEKWRQRRCPYYESDQEEECDRRIERSLENIVRYRHEDLSRYDDNMGHDLGSCVGNAHPSKWSYFGATAGIYDDCGPVVIEPDEDSDGGDVFSLDL